MFKKLVEKMTVSNDDKIIFEICGEIDMAYQQEKISFKEHEILFSLVQRIVCN